MGPTHRPVGCLQLGRRSIPPGYWANRESALDAESAPAGGDGRQMMRPDELERQLGQRLDALGPAPRAELLHVLKPSDISVDAFVSLPRVGVPEAAP